MARRFATDMGQTPKIQCIEERCNAKRSTVPRGRLNMCVNGAAAGKDC